MCGITGYYSPGRYDLKTNIISDMAELIRHRGYDDEGYTFLDTKSNIFKNVSGPSSMNQIKNELPDIKSVDNISHDMAFAHRRYSIIDLTVGGHQPFWDENHSVCISFNGEIYNYIELREELEQKGCKFVTTSDTEVLVKSYIEWGESCFKKFNGVWAISLYDTNKHKLLLSRDRIGKSPLYYTIRNNVLYWSSEIKSLLCACGTDAFSINEQTIYDFINHSLRDVDNNTFWNEIHTFPAATYAWADKSLNFQKHVYWTIPSERLKTSDVTFDDAKKQLKILMIDAMNIRLRADISIGFTLSGGMDSSSLLALYVEVFKKSTVSFTAKFSQKDANEEHFARMVAERCGKLVDYNVIEPPFDDFWNDANNYVWLIEEPFHSPNIYIEQLLFKKLKSKGFGVIITGNGGDELLAGYDYIYFTLYLDYLLCNSKWSFIREIFSWTNKNFSAFVLTAQSILSLSPTIKNFVKKSMRKENSFLRGMNGVKKRDMPSNFNDCMVGNMGQWLMNYWLRVGNKSSSGIPVETRFPFLDYRLLDFVFRLPPEYLIYNGWHKYILRKTVEDLLPKDVVWRKNKMGFPFPYTEWLISSKQIIEKNLRNVNCPYVDTDRLFDEYDQMTRSNPTLLWRYISLLLWWKRVITKETITSCVS